MYLKAHHKNFDKQFTIFTAYTDYKYSLAAVSVPFTIRPLRWK